MMSHLNTIFYWLLARIRENQGGGLGGETRQLSGVNQDYGVASRAAKPTNIDQC